MRVRDPFFDNAKYFAILLVVLGHAWTAAGVRDMHAGRAAYVFVYAFHMPVFIFIAGFFSRSFSHSPARVRKLLATVAAPYLIFEVIYRVQSGLLAGVSLNANLLDPFSLLWFLIALFVWRLTVPLWQNMRWPVTTSVVVALLSGMSLFSQVATVSRVLSLLPFFVFGLTVDPERLNVLRRPVVRVLAVPTLLGGLAAAYLLGSRVSLEWIWWRKGYHAMHFSWLEGMALRLAMLLVAAVLTAAFLALVPRRRAWFTTLGAGTMAAYVLHGLFVKTADYLGWFDNSFVHSRIGAVVVSLAAVVLGTLLCTERVRRVMQWALEPRLEWAFSRR